MAKPNTSRNDMAAGLAFLAPNILGFLIFTLLPLIFSLALAFTNWDLRLHNMFREESLKFVGLENFTRLLSEPDFWQYFGNTLFLMMGIPVGIAASLFAAILLSQNLKGGSGRVWGRLIASAVLIASLLMLFAAGAHSSGMLIFLTGLLGMTMLSGTIGGTTVYRTLFYLPHFTAGVATFILWKKLYNPHSGPINSAIRPVLDILIPYLSQVPAGVVQAGTWVASALAVLLILFGTRRLWLEWKEGEMGIFAILVGIGFLLTPVVYGVFWNTSFGAGIGVAVFSGGCVLFGLASHVMRGRDFTCASDKGIGHAAIVCALLMIAQFMLLGLGNLCAVLPELAAAGLDAPEWLTQYHWAKPALMLMGLWGAMGSNNMLMYLAGLSNVPPELHEAASIDGASPMQRFWNVTWPQLAPVTFFIVIMSVIGGLQGGFEMAKTMTQGGPAGATTTLSYFVFTEGFETGRLGYASAIAWTMFALVFGVTLVNWKFGNRYAGE